MKLLAFVVIIPATIWLAYATIDSMLLSSVHLTIRRAVARERR